MVTARHAMLATVRGRLGDALRLAERVLESGRRAGLADTADLYGALRGMVLLEQGNTAGGGLHDWLAGSAALEGQPILTLMTLSVDLSDQVYFCELGPSGPSGPVLGSASELGTLRCWDMPSP